MVSKPVVFLVLACAAYAQATTGQRQSPINIQTADAIQISPSGVRKPLDFVNYRSSKNQYSVLNNGHGIEINFENSENKPTLSGGPLSDTYTLQQIHFHWGKQNGQGSEHTLNGESSSMEVHLVHWNSDLYKSYSEAASKPNGLAVIGFFMEGLDLHNQYVNPEFQRVVELIPAVKAKKGDKVYSDSDLLTWVVPYLKSNGYFTYDGSLTTEPYTENVRWIQFRNPVIVGRTQVEAFRKIKDSHEGRLLTNKRAVQSLNGRKVYYVVEA